MPRETIQWVPVSELPNPANARLARLADLTEGSTRAAVLPTVTASRTLVLSWPLTVQPVDTASGNVTVTLPTARSVVGYTVTVKKLGAANTLTIDGAGAETIDGAATVALTAAGASRTVVSTGAGWLVVATT